MGVFKRGTKLWITFKDVDGKWRNVTSTHSVGQEALAQAKYDALVASIKASKPIGSTGPLTVRAFAKPWLAEREKLDLDWKNDRSRLDHWILPTIGDLPIANVRTRHILDLVQHVRTTPSETTGEPVSPRTVYNVYSVVSALFRDAKLADKIEQTPCCLDERQLGARIDKNAEWRSEAVFARDEVETIISHDAIPADRQMVYALELLAGVRPGEASALRWRHYDAAAKPLGRLLVAHAYNTRKHRQKGTKTDSVKHIPVHPTLAAMLAEWKLGGWAAMHGRAPEPDDLIVPLPPAAAARRRTRDGEPFRGHDYSGKRWREEDLPALGWRHRRHYDMRATFITLALEDGADAHVIETRVTHTKKSRSAFDGYNRGRQWEATCAEVAKLRIVRRTGELVAMPIAASATADSPYGALTATASTENQKGNKWKRRESNMPPLTLHAGGRTSSHEVTSRDVSPSDVECEGAVTASLQDPVDRQVSAALDAWRADRDVAALRRALARVLDDLSG
jgi:integrase